jgi:hypothetical protein
MWHDFRADASIRALLLAFDEAVLGLVKAEGCSRCGGRLDRADYPRKPRGAEIDPEGEQWNRRLSLCCCEDGCRRRSTPPSARFLGRKVYLGIVVAIAPAVLQQSGDVGFTCAATGVPARTTRRWRSWWQAAFVESAFFLVARGFLREPISASLLPLMLLDRFAGSAEEKALALLRFVSPVTTTSLADGSRFSMAVR